MIFSPDVDLVDLPYHDHSKNVKTNFMLASVNM